MSRNGFNCARWPKFLTSAHAVRALVVARCARNAIRCSTRSNPGPGGAAGRALRKEINLRVFTQHPFADFRVRSPPPGPTRTANAAVSASCHPGNGHPAASKICASAILTQERHDRAVNSGRDQCRRRVCRGRVRGGPARVCAATSACGAHTVPGGCSSPTKAAGADRGSSQPSGTSAIRVSISNSPRAWR